VTSGPGPVVALLVVGTAVFGPARASAQGSRIEADLGGSRIEYDSLAPLDAFSISALGEWQNESLFARAVGGVSRFGSAEWSAQGRATLAGWVAPAGNGSPVRLELGGSAGGSHYSGGFDTGSGSLDGRVHLLGRRIGAWVGAGAATAKNSEDSSSVTGLMPGVGVWVRGRSLLGTVGYVHARVDGDMYPELTASLTLTEGSLDLTLYGGLRSWPGDAGALDETWVGATAALWVLPRAALVLSGGGYGADVLQGLPGGQFLSVALRVTPRRVRPIPVTAVAPIVFTLEEARAGQIVFEVEGASRVEIVGDWNGWQRVPLSRSGRGRWALPTPLEPGTYRFNLLVDGERWLVPEGVPSIDDGFGGAVGLLIVE